MANRLDPIGYLQDPTGYAWSILQDPKEYYDFYNANQWFPLLNSHVTFL